MEDVKAACPLCNTPQTTFFHHSEERDYRLCPVCDLVFVPETFFLSPEAEKAKYDHHQNTLQNSGYVNFLNRLRTPLEKSLKPGAEGLDFGSGPGPTLHLLMEERGYRMEIYDHFYAHYPQRLEREYDFITSTEVIEHLHRPREVIEQLWSILKPGGVLGIMTAFRVEDFSQWYYKRDLTHICFYTPETFRWIAKHLGATLSLPQSGVAILHKNGAKSP